MSTEPAAVPDDSETGKASDNSFRHVSEARLTGNVGLRDAVDTCRTDRTLRVKPSHPLVHYRAGLVEADDRHLQDAVPLRRQTRRLHIDDRKRRPAGASARRSSRQRRHTLHRTGPAPEQPVEQSHRHPSYLGDRRPKLEALRPLVSR